MRTLLLAALLVATLPLPAAPAPQTLLEDRFEAPDGAPLDPAKWDERESRSKGVLQSRMLLFRLDAGALMSREPLPCPEGSTLEVEVEIVKPAEALSSRVTFGLEDKKTGVGILLVNRGFETDSKNLSLNVRNRAGYLEKGFRPLMVGNYGRFKVAWTPAADRSVITVFHDGAKLERISTTEITAEARFHAVLGYVAGSGEVGFRNFSARLAPAAP
jgi:hypothetical protein